MPRRGWLCARRHLNREEALDRLAVTATPEAVATVPANLGVPVPPRQMAGHRRSVGMSRHVRSYSLVPSRSEQSPEDKDQ